MLARRPLTTGELLGLLAATLVVLLLLPVRTATTFTTLAIVFAASLATLAVAVSLLTYRGRPLDVADGFGVVVAATVLVVPTAILLVAIPTVSTAGFAALAPETLWRAIPDALRLVVQWALPATLAFPLGLARTDRTRALVGVTLLAVLVAAFVVVPPTSLGSTGATVARFVGAAFLGGPLFVAARAFPQRPDRLVAGVR